MQIPAGRTPLRLSKPLFVILLSTALLAGLLISTTLRNLSREQHLMESFLLDEGLTLIRSFEAGARTTMMHEMMGVDPPLVTLVRETAKADRIAYITIITETGTVVASAGDHDPGLDRNLTRRVLQDRQPVTMLKNPDSEEPIFEIATVFQSLAGTPKMPGMMGHHRRNRFPELELLEQGRAVIHLGLRTGEFVRARQQDLKHSIFMGAMLFVLGMAGFYFLFLYQGMRITRTTLANMRLYTRNIIESMPDGLITLDSRGRIVSGNPRALEFTGLDLETLQGRFPEDLFPNWPTSGRQQGERVTSFSYTFVHDDGKEVPVEISGSALLDGEGENLGAVLILRDLREIRSMQEQLARSRRLAALGRMAAAIAHEIRNPLGTLRGFAQYFGTMGTDEAAREYSTLMIGEVDRLNGIISSLLQFARPREPEFAVFRPEELLDKATQLLEADLGDNHITIRREGRCPASMEGDSDLLLQVLLNLIKNAIQASEPGSVIVLGCEQDDTNVHITVSDQGTGMDPKQREQMFDPFFTTRKNGTGLGLAVSHQIVEQHHGVFEVRSRPGQGTTIIVTLPLTQGEQRKP